MKGKYYEARITDEGNSKRLVGSHPQQCDKLVQFKNKPIMLDNRSITKSKYSEDLEVVVNKSTMIAASSKKLSDHLVTKGECSECSTFLLVQLPVQMSSSMLMLLQKVLRIDDGTQVKANLKKTRCIHS